MSDQVKIVRDAETKQLAVFNPNSSVPVHVGSKYWFKSEAELHRELRNRGLCWNKQGEVFNRQGRPAVRIFSWWREAE